jgi:hypothetical protein
MTHWTPLPKSMDLAETRSDGTVGRFERPVIARIDSADPDDQKANTLQARSIVDAVSLQVGRKVEDKGSGASF